MEPQPPVRPRDLVAIVTTACSFGTVAFIHWKVLPWYVAVMQEGGYSMPLPLQTATAVLPYVFLGLFFWIFYLLLRCRRAPHLFPLARVLMVVNVVSVVALMALSSGFATFAMHGLKAVHNVVTAQEQSQAKHAMPPRTTVSQPR
jgi:hypothetical protein